MFDSYFDDTLQNCDSMFGYKLLESNEEGTLEGDGALDESQSRARRKRLVGSSEDDENTSDIRS